MVGDQTSENKGVDIPALILELAELLKKHPVMILNTPDRLKVCEGQKWAAQNWETSKRISHLVYMNPDEDLKYASNASGSWNTEVVDDVGWYVGRHCSIFLDAAESKQLF